MDKYIGKRIEGRYEIRELVGVGGMANVYRAYDVIEDRVVAVKILRDEYAQNEEFLRRFKNESKAISVLSHPNIVKIYDVSFSDRLNSIVMEYVDGITLKEYIEQQRVLPYREALHFTVQILRALQHAHSKGVVHRDIKPQNIMLMSDGTIKVTDFGIARFARSESRSLTDKAIGSVHYISPEQASGAPSDARSDLYSVGVMLFEMLTGKLPFEADSPVSVAIKQIQSQPLRPRALNPDIPEGLEQIIIRAMQKDVDRRYQSAAEMLRDIDEFKRNPSVSFEYKYFPADQSPGRTARKRQKPAGKTSRKMPKQQPEEGQGPKSIPVIPVLAGISFAFALVSGLFILMLFLVNDPFAVVPDVTAPNLVGQDYEQVVRSREYHDLVNIEVEETRFNADYPEGTIYRQEPVAGRTVKQGSTVRVMVSAGIQTVVLTDYAGQEATEVYQKLRAQGLDYDEFQVFSDTVPEGYVVRTDPASQTEVQSGELVTVYVSRGPQQRTTRVPDLTGMNIDDAKRMLASYKLRVNQVREVEDEDEDPGTVLEQTPPADTKVDEGSAVDLVVVEGYVNRLLRGDGITVEVELPDDIDEEVLVEAVVDGETIVSEEMNPAEDEVWSVTFTNDDGGIVYVRIYVDDDYYARYRLDFDEGTYDRLR